MSSVRGVDFSRTGHGSEVGARVRVARVDALFANGPLLVAGAVVSGALPVLVLWGRVESSVLLDWLVLLYLWTLARAGLVLLYKRLSPPMDRAIRWGWANATFSTVYGALWGGGAVLFLAEGDPLAVVAVPVLIMGLNAVATVSLTPFPPAYIGFALISNGLLAVGIVYADTDMTSPLLALVMISLASNLINMKNLSRVLDSSLRLRFENQALRAESERKSGLLETTLANMSQGIGLLDGRGWLRMWNLRLTALLGRQDSGDERVKLEALRERLRPLPGDGDPGASLWCNSEGGILEFRETPIADGETVVTCTDVSLLKGREQALKAARNKAELASAAKTRFLAAASHDLRQPVHALGLLHSVLADRTRETDLQDVVGEIGQGVKAVDGLLQELLDISKLEAGLDKPSLVPCALDEVFRDLAEEFRVVAEQRGIRLDFRDSVLSVNSDRTMLLRMLRNLVVNAVNYTDNGRVLVAARVRGERVCIAVYDTGPGIPEAQQERIFEEFQQLHNPQRDRRYGLGLGLAIVRHTANLLGHQVSVSSRPGYGSRFEVCALRVLSAAPTVSVKAERPGPSVEFLRGRLLWVVDDDPIVLLAVRKLLEHWGGRVETAEDFDRAVVLAKRGESVPDGLLLDYRLPGGITGLDTARELFAVLGRELPALLITGDTAPERLVEASAGGIPLLHKPVSAEKLHAAVMEMLAGEDDVR